MADLFLSIAGFLAFVLFAGSFLGMFICVIFVTSPWDKLSVALVVIGYPFCLFIVGIASVVLDYLAVPDIVVSTSVFGIVTLCQILIFLELWKSRTRASRFQPREELRAQYDNGSQSQFRLALEGETSPNTRRLESHVELSSYGHSGVKPAVRRRDSRGQLSLPLDEDRS